MLKNSVSSTKCKCL